MELTVGEADLCYVALTGELLNSTVLGLNRSRGSVLGVGPQYICKASKGEVLVGHIVCMCFS